METMDELQELPPLDDEPPTRGRPGPSARPSPPGARSSTSSSATKKRAAKPSQESALRRIGEELTQAFVLVGTALTPFLPVTGTTLVARGPMGADVVVNIARKDERVLRALLAVSKYAVYGELVLFVGSLGIAVTVDLGQQDPNSFVAQRLLGDIIAEVYARRSNGQGPGDSRPAAPAPVPAGWTATPTA